MTRLLWRISLALLPIALAVDVADAQRPDRDSVTAAAIQPGDIVRLRIWREPDLSGEFLVNESSIVVFPKLGPLSVVEETAQSLSQRLISAYQEFLKNPSVEITVLRRINIMGAVKNPGLYPVDPTTTVADAVALAGGATPDGDRKRIELLRGGKRLDVALTDQSRVADLRLASGDQIFIPEKSWISRNPAVIAASLSATVSLIIALLLR